VKIRLVSNGNGEDLIASNLIEAIKQVAPKASIDAYPLVGNGILYKKNGITPAITNPTFPSGGFIRTKKDLITDIQAGLLSHLFMQYQKLKNTAPDYSHTICVGDIFCLWMGSRNTRSSTTFLPTAKSDHFMKHSWLEKTLMKSLADTVYTRDLITAKSLQSARISAHFLGNPMMDQFINTLNENTTVPNHIVCLPGSRDEAYQNLAHILHIIEENDDPSITFSIAKAPSLSLEKLAKYLTKRSWHINITHDCATLIHNLQHVPILDNFTETLAKAHLVLGVSGTANEQAVYLGKTVIAFEGFGPQSTKQRFQEQQKLLGQKLILSSTNNPQSVLKLLKTTLLTTPEKTPELPSSKTSASLAIIKHMLNKI
jgi:uncharacterized protein (TIGR03492 family)